MPRDRIWTSSLLMTMAAWAGGIARGEEDFPYDAYVAVEAAEVVSGPGHRYYATERLPLGAKVDVYREEASGWLAIRPTENAFSWVPAETIERTGDEGLGRVTEPTPSWIGTSAEQVTEHRQQVTLKVGEQVQILGEKRVSGDGDEEQSWLKIAPPAGEFRWIHLRDVSRQRPESPPVNSPDSNSAPSERQQAALDDLRSMLRKTADGTSEPSVEPRRFEPMEGAIALEDLATPSTSSIAQAQFRSSLDQSPSLSPDGFVPRKRKSGSEQLHPVPSTSPRLTSAPAFTSTSSYLPRVASTAPSGVQPIAPSTRSTAEASSAGIAADQLVQRLAQIELELSQMLSQDRSLWDLASIKQRVDELVDHGADPHSRGRARLLLEKIQQFEQAFDVDQYGPIQSVAAAPSSAPANALADPRYDGLGWLKPVVSRKSDQPLAPYALVDREGKPLCFITPTPGLNVHRYLNKQVGVYGKRGYIEELKTPHVVAERVIALDTALR